MQMGLALLAFILAIPWMPIKYAIYNMGHTCLGVLSTQYNKYDSTWGFGQIVATLVWAPTLCDYFWDQARMLHGLQLSSFLLHDLSFALLLFGKLDWKKPTFGASSLCGWG